MDYTVQKLAEMAGISSRTLRYYDQIGLLRPARSNRAGYRIYSEKEVDRLQQILFYRELGISLENIRAILDAPFFDELEALQQHKKLLMQRRQQLEELLTNIDQTIAFKERRIEDMSDKEKFAGFKQKLIDENDQKYGREIRAKYGNDEVDKSNLKIKGWSEEQYHLFQNLGVSIMKTLEAAIATGAPDGELGQEVAALHHQWLSLIWGRYSKEAHAGLARTYVEDERFAAYYDQVAPGAAVFLRDAILIYTGMAGGF